MGMIPAECMLYLVPFSSVYDPRRAVNPMTFKMGKPVLVVWSMIQFKKLGVLSPEGMASMV